MLGEKVFKSCFVQLPLFSREPLPCGVWKATKLIYKRFKHEMEGTLFKEFIDTQARVSRLFDILLNLCHSVVFSNICDNFLTLRISDVENPEVPRGITFCVLH